MNLGHDISSPFENQLVLELGCRELLLASSRSVQMVAAVVAQECRSWR
jgi:hypothetical protein